MTQNMSLAQNVLDLEVELKVGTLKVHICGIEVSWMSVLMIHLSRQFHLYEIAESSSIQKSPVFRNLRTSSNLLPLEQESTPISNLQLIVKLWIYQSDH